MKHTLFILTIFLSLLGCTPEDDDFTVQGRLQREANGEGVANRIVYLEVYEHRGGSTPWAFNQQIDSLTVMTDANGNFKVKMDLPSDGFVSAYSPENDTYHFYEKNFDTNEPIILNVQKYLKFKVYVNSTNPFDDNDFVHVDAFSADSQSFMTGIENFGADNVYYPEENWPGGGGIGGAEASAWYGTNVNSIVYYSVPENTEYVKLHWYKRKNGVNTEGFSPEIPYQVDAVNEYHFEY